MTSPNHSESDPESPRLPATINFRNLEPGTRLKLVGDLIVEVTENPKDGYWLVGRWLSVPLDPASEGKEAMILCYDVVDYA